MAYLTITLNHMRAVKAWADAHGAEVDLDLRNWELEVRCRHRYFRFHPRFLARRGARVFHTEDLVEQVTGFIGWLPYRVLRLDLSSEKLAFKSFAAGAGLTVPATWPAEAPEGDYVLKRSAGSFGDEITGPYRVGQGVVRTPADRMGGAGAASQVFAEAFVHGDALKVWFWGRTPFFAHRQAWPAVEGDGRSTLRSLVGRRIPLAAGQGQGQGSAELDFLQDVLAYQELGLDDVLPAGRRAWLDFRYGRTFAPEQLSAGSDSDLEALPASVLAQVERMGAVMGSELEKSFPAPILYAADAVLDAQGAVHWLEINSNPMLPPDGYARIFATLFGPPGERT